MKKGLKKLAVLGIVAAISIGMVGCGKKSESTSSNETKSESMLEKVKSSGKLVIGTAPGFPPFEFMQSKDGKGEVVGADIDLAKKITDKLGVKLEIKAMDFDALLMALQAEKIDVAITGMTPTDERKKVVDFSKLYYEGTNSVIVKSDSNVKLNNEDDLKQLKVGVQKGSTQEVYALETLKIKNTKSLVSIPDLIADLKNGNIDAIVVNTTVAQINVKQYDGIKIKENLDLKSYKGGETMAIAIKKGNNKELIKIMDEVITELKNSGEYEKILKKNVDIASSNKDK